MNLFRFNNHIQGKQTMTKENALSATAEQLNDDLTESFDFDELEETLQNQLEEELADLQFLKEEKDKIGSSENLGNVIMDVVWEQFLNQYPGATAVFRLVPPGKKK